MNKIMLLSVFLFLTLIPLASATPVIQVFPIQPSNDLWLGEKAIISVNCYDNETINNVYANIASPHIYLTKDFNNVSGSWDLLIDTSDLGRIEEYSVNIFCENDEGNISTNSTSFTVSKLTGYIKNINPKPAYTGDTIEIDYVLNKNDTVLDGFYDVNFNIFLNEEQEPLRNKFYDIDKGWVLLIDPQSSDNYNVKVIAFYNRTNVTNYSSIEVRNSIEFNIESIDKNWIKSNDNITVTLKALEKGNVIDLNKNNIDIRINSVNAEITTISKHDNLFDVKIIVPTLPSGIYKIEAYLNRNGYTYSDSELINYIVSVSGSILDSNNKAMNVQIKFIQNDVTKLSLTTDSYGYYSGSLPPDNYDLEINFPRSTLYLDGVPINSFDDPVKYFYSDEFDVPGIRNAGLYDYEIALSYSNANIEMIYSEKNVINENNLKIFKCSNWNSGRKKCNSDWTEIIGDIDIVRNKVRINSSTLSAFIIGEIKGINVDFSLDKETYYLNDKIKIRGLVKDEDRNSVINASIEVYVKNTQISSKIITDENGIFSLEITTPKDEGEYELVLKAKKYPYKEFNGNKDFEVIKSKSILINFPDTVKIARGENLTQELSLVNTGQADIDKLKVYFEGIPENYYKFSENVSLKSGEEKTFYIKFSIPFYAEVGVSSATLKLEGNNISQEKVFGLNIFEKSENKTSAIPTTGLASGFAIPEINYLDVIYIALFAITCFSIAIIIKKKKIVKSDRAKIKNLLFDVKSFVKTEENETQPQERTSKSIYDKLILTEFPNLLKFSKKLIKTKNLGDINGKDN